MNYVKTDSGASVKVPTQGQVNYGTIAGSAGLASFFGLNAKNILGGNGCGNGGGIFNGGNGNGCECYETKEASCLREQISVLAAENFSRAAATQAFQDSVTFSSTQNDKQAANIAKLFDTVIAQGQEVAVLKADIRCLSAINEKDHTILRDYTTASVNLEAERRSSADENLACNFNSKLAWKADYAPYIDGQKVFCPDSSICGGVLIAGGCTSCANTKQAKQ